MHISTLTSMRDRTYRLSEIGCSTPFSLILEMLEYENRLIANSFRDGSRVWGCGDEGCVYGGGGRGVSVGGWVGGVLVSLCICVCVFW